MKSQLYPRLRMWILAGLALTAVLGAARAFPPAPDHVIYGIIRDELGEPIVVTNALVVLQTSANVQLTAAITPFLAPGMNYRLTVPMDSGLTADAYKPTALRPTVPFRIKVQIDNVVYLPIQMQGDYSHLGLPAQETRLDLTLGADSTGDGIPDAWKRMIVSMSGGLYTNISQIHPSGHYPGNPMTFLQSYIAGTYPWDLADGFALAIVSFDSGNPVMAFLAIQNRTYGIQGSSDLSQWAPVQFQIVTDSSRSDPLTSYQATDVRRVQVIVPPQAGMTNRFFKAIVQ